MKTTFKIPVSKLETAVFSQQFDFSYDAAI